jgi:hypothetical protein
MNNYLLNAASWWQSVPFGTKGLLIVNSSFWLVYLIFGWGFYEFWVVDPSRFV